MAKCIECGKMTLAPSIDWKVIDNKWICPDCYKENPEINEIQKKLSDIILTTTNNLEGYEILEYLGIESVELVMGTGIISEVVSDLSDLIGERSGQFEDKMANAKKNALTRLRKKAFDSGGNAVIGIELDYPVYSGNKMGVVVYGTVVKTKKITP